MAMMGARFWLWLSRFGVLVAQAEHGHHKGGGSGFGCRSLKPSLRQCMDNPVPLSVDVLRLITTKEAGNGS